MSKCGECLMNDVEIVELGEDGICPKCGADYSAVLGATGQDRKSYSDDQDRDSYVPDPDLDED